MISEEVGFYFLYGLKESKAKGDKELNNPRCNEDIRRKIEKKGIKHYEIAYQLGITEYTFSKWLHVPLSEERRKRILDVIYK